MQKRAIVRPRDFRSALLGWRGANRAFLVARNYNVCIKMRPRNIAGSRPTGVLLSRILCVLTILIGVATIFSHLVR